MQTVIDSGPIINRFERLFTISQYPANGRDGKFNMVIPGYVERSCAIPCQTHINMVYMLLTSMMEYMDFIPANNYKSTELYTYLYNLPNSNIIYNICTHWKPVNWDWAYVLLQVAKEVIHDWQTCQPYKLIVKEKIKCKTRSELACDCKLGSATDNTPKQK